MKTIKAKGNGLYGEVTFSKHGENINDLPKTDIMNNGDVVFHCCSIEDAKLFVARIASWYGYSHSLMSQKEE